MSQDRNLLARYEGQRPWPMLAALLVAALLGSIAIPVQVLLAKQGQAASREQVQHNEQVVRDAAKITHRNQQTICLKVDALLPPAEAAATPCPTVEP